MAELKTQVTEVDPADFIDAVGHDGKREEGRVLDAIFRRVKDVVQRDRQFDRAQIRRQMPAGLRDGLDQEGAKLIGDDCQFAAIQGAQVGR